MQTAKKIDTAALALIAVGAHKHPTRGTVDGHKQITPRALIWHLGQVFDVNVYIPWLVVFEGLFRHLLTLYGRLQLCQFRHTLSAQQPTDARARRLCVYELFRHAHQIIQRQQTQPTYFQHDRLLGAAQCRVQLLGPV